MLLFANNFALEQKNLAKFWFPSQNSSLGEEQECNHLPQNRIKLMNWSAIVNITNLSPWGCIYTRAFKRNKISVQVIPTQDIRLQRFRPFHPTNIQAMFEINSFKISDIIKISLIDIDYIFMNLIKFFLGYNSKQNFWI